MNAIDNHLVVWALERSGRQVLPLSQQVFMPETQRRGDTAKRAAGRSMMLWRHRRCVDFVQGFRCGSQLLCRGEGGRAREVVPEAGVDGRLGSYRVERGCKMRGSAQKTDDRRVAVVQLWHGVEQVRDESCAALHGFQGFRRRRETMKTEIRK